MTDPTPTVPGPLSDDDVAALAAKVEHAHAKLARQAAELAEAHAETEHVRANITAERLTCDISADLRRVAAAFDAMQVSEQDGGALLREAADKLDGLITSLAKAERARDAVRIELDDARREHNADLFAARQEMDQARAELAKAQRDARNKRAAELDRDEWRQLAERSVVDAAKIALERDQARADADRMRADVERPAVQRLLVHMRGEHRDGRADEACQACMTIRLSDEAERLRAELAKLDPGKVAAWITERDELAGQVATVEQENDRFRAELAAARRELGLCAQARRDLLDYADGLAGGPDHRSLIADGIREFLVRPIITEFGGEDAH